MRMNMSGLLGGGGGGKLRTSRHRPSADGTSRPRGGLGVQGGAAKAANTISLGLEAPFGLDPLPAPGDAGG
jgi:hypothetical protein